MRVYLPKSHKLAKNKINDLQDVQELWLQRRQRQLVKEDTGRFVLVFMCVWCVCVCVCVIGHATFRDTFQTRDQTKVSPTIGKQLMFWSVVRVKVS